MTIVNQSENSLLTVKQFSQKHSAFTEGSLRHLIFFSEKNGFEMAIVRIGRRILIDESSFFKWVKTLQKVENQ